MATNWNRSVENCGNCAFWPLAGYQHDWKGAEPQGTGGYMCDGTVSDCRRHAPREVHKDRYPGASAQWPQTNRNDFCGDFELRG